MQNRITKLEEFVASQSYEQITDMETSFLMGLYSAILEITREGGRVSLLRMSKIVRVPPSELVDYLPEILEMERQITEGGYLE